jgi:hypothetical protein
VVSIGSGAFEGMVSLTTVTFSSPSSLTYLGDYAFAANPLLNCVVNLPAISRAVVFASSPDALGGCPTASPSAAPSTSMPSATPSYPPTASPSTLSPSYAPTRAPTRVPTKKPSAVPTRVPTKKPSRVPTIAPSKTPSLPPTILVTASPSFFASAPPSYPSGILPICMYGGYCTTNGAAPCVGGTFCSVQSVWYSQCIPDSTTDLTSGCTSNYQSCSLASTCCSSAFTCVSGTCVPIAPPNCVNPTGYSSLTSSPIPTPTLLPLISMTPSVRSTTIPSVVPTSLMTTATSSSSVCLYGGYCTTSGGRSPCVAGTYCNIQSIWYSQCLIDASTDLISGCTSNYMDCSITSTCCSGAFVCSPTLKTCQPKTSPYCVSPTGYV